MLNYRGQYRVIFEIDKRTGMACEFSYIPILGGGNICRHDDKTLNVFISSNRGKFLLKDYPDLFRVFQQGQTEMTLLFDESNIKQVAAILKVKIQGKNVSPRAKRNRLTKTHTL